MQMWLGFIPLPLRSELRDTNSLLLKYLNSYPGRSVLCKYVYSDPGLSETEGVSLLSFVVQYKLEHMSKKSEGKFPN